MSRFQPFEEIEVWQKARELTKQIDALSNDGQFAHDFGLRDQIHRTSGSIMPNIAESFERGSIRSLSNSSALPRSLLEKYVHSSMLFYVVFDQSYINQPIFDQLSKALFEISKMISGLIHYLQKSSFKGEKR